MSDSIDSAKFGILKSEIDLSSFENKNRGIHQIVSTIAFESTRNLKKLVIMAVVNTILIALFWIINYLEDAQPEEAVAYILSYLGMISFVIIIIAITFGSAIIVEDFEKQTGNILFPKIERGRLLVGRYITRYVYAAVSLVVYYAEIALLTYLEYEMVPEIMWESLGWAILYLHLVMAFVVLMSALLNRIATVMVISILILLIVFSMITTILKFTESTMEPWFILTYYANIITSWFDMPDPRFREINTGLGPGAVVTDNTRTFLSWATPSAEGALIGMILYSALFLLSAYLRYRSKQAKD